MIRAFLIACAAVCLLGAKRAPTVDYRLGVVPQNGPPLLEVEMRFRGDADGETRLELPDRWASAKESWRFISGLEVKGASVAEPDPAHRVLVHRPNAKITVRYRVRTAYEADPAGADGNPYAGPLIRPDWFAVIGQFVFATPEGRDHLPATFRWGRLPKGWQVASDLEHGRMGRPMSVRDLTSSISVGGPRMVVVEREVSGGAVRVAGPEGSHQSIPALADEVARVIAAERAFWGDASGPYFVAFVPLTPVPKGSSSGGTGLGDAFVLYATPNSGDRMRWNIAHEHTHTWIPNRVGAQPSGPEQMRTSWFHEGFTDFFTFRTLVRGSAATPQETAAMMSESLTEYDNNPRRLAPASQIVADFWNDRNVQRLPYQRGFLLALKWDEELRLKTGGKVDLDDVILRMRDHYQTFPPGQGPDVVTGLVSAAWVTARVDLRPDIERYAVRGEPIPLPETLFDGCLQVREFTRPAFDTGFDHKGSLAARRIQGVRRDGPAWNSGLRNGVSVLGMNIQEGDTAREVEVTVQPPGRRSKPRTHRYWPYGDEQQLSTRSLALSPGLQGEALAACGRKVGGL